MVSPSSKPSEKIPRLVAFRATAEIAQYSEALKLQDMVVAPSPAFEEQAPLAQLPSSLQRTVCPGPGDMLTQLACVPTMSMMISPSELGRLTEAVAPVPVAKAPASSPKASFFLPLLVFVSWERVLMQQSEHPQEIPLILERILVAVFDTMDISPQFRRMIAIDEQAEDAGLYRSHQASPSFRKSRIIIKDNLSTATDK
ncbi:MAG: hypothetical protein K8R59_01685 [Thermoanaerobaculales bacterium]|nr:hypothetical protein [Thermoanaerobaculales bacterium]